jgi:hypothetical protein
MKSKNGVMTLNIFFLSMVGVAAEAVEKGPGPNPRKSLSRPL